MATKPLKNLIQHEAYRLVFLQLGGVLLLTAITFLMRGPQTSFAVLAGGLAYGLPNLAFVWVVFRYVGAHRVTQFIIAFFMGEMIKLVISAVLFVIVANYLKSHLVAELIGFIGAIIAFWIVCLWHFSRKKTNTAHIVEHRESA